MTGIIADGNIFLDFSFGVKFKRETTLIQLGKVYRSKIWPWFDTTALNLEKRKR